MPLIDGSSLAGHRSFDEQSSSSNGFVGGRVARCDVEEDGHAFQFIRRPIIVQGSPGLRGGVQPPSELPFIRLGHRHFRVGRTSVRENRMSQNCLPTPPPVS